MNRPERELDDGGESQDGEAVASEQAVQQVHEVKKKLAHQFEHPEVHDLGFIVRKLRETMVKFRPGIDFKARAVSLPGLQLKAGHTERSLNAEQFLVERALDIETPAPNGIDLGRKRSQQCRIELVTHRSPFRPGDIFLIKRLRSALAHAEKSSAAAKPANIDPFRFSIDAPDQSCV